MSLLANYTLLIQKLQRFCKNRKKKWKSGPVDVKGVDKAKLLQKMWERSFPAMFFKLTPGVEAPETLDYESAKDYLQKEIPRLGLDYCNGRAIKTKFSGPKIDFSQFDEYMKEKGAGLRIVEELRGNQCTHIDA